jgi:hypothetical protein
MNIYHQKISRSHYILLYVNQNFKLKKNSVFKFFCSDSAKTGSSKEFYEYINWLITNPPTDLQDQYFAASPRIRILEKLSNGLVRERDFLKNKSETWPGRDQESCSSSLETEMRTWRYLCKFLRFPIFRVETWPETWMSLRPRLTNNQNWCKTETRPRVSVSWVSKQRQDRESHQSVNPP